MFSFHAKNFKISPFKLIYFNVGGGRVGRPNYSGGYDCSGGGVKGWEDPFNGHHEEKGGSNVKYFLK